MLDLAVIVFKHAEGADHAYAEVLRESGDAPWAHEIAFVEHHRHDRLVVRGTFAGRYVDFDEEGDVVGRRTAEGALTGAVAGVVFGPPGFAVGIVAGATTGGIAESHHATHLHDAFVEEVRADVPERASGVLLLAAPDHVDGMIAAFEGHGGRVVRRSLSEEAALALARAVAGSPRAAR